jgi:hypothetical protein
VVAMGEPLLNMRRERSGSPGGAPNGVPDSVSQKRSPGVDAEAFQGGSISRILSGVAIQPDSILKPSRGPSLWVSIDVGRSDMSRVEFRFERNAPADRAQDARTERWACLNS